MKFLLIALLAALTGLLGACRPSEQTTAPAGPADTTNAANDAPAASTNVQTFLVRGVVKKVEAADRRVSIQHEEIPNFMPAMTMPFRVKDAAELDGVQPGDAIWFRLWVTADESWIDRVKKEESQAAAQAPAPEREAVRVARDVPVLREGDLLPNYTLTNELGSAVQLNGFRGQVLAFTFFFSRCPLPEFCPRMAHNFQDVMRQLKEMPKGPTNWHLLSISFDPHFDTPEVLRGYAQAFQADSNRWNFVTGAMIDIDALTDHFELTVVKRGNEWDHKLRTVVVDPHGRIQKIIFGNEWKPAEVVEAMTKAAQNPPPAAASGE